MESLSGMICRINSRNDCLRVVRCCTGGSMLDFSINPRISDYNAIQASPNRT
jgi:hypothetical protein